MERKRDQLIMRVIVDLKLMSHSTRSLTLITLAQLAHEIGKLSLNPLGCWFDSLFPQFLATCQPVP